MPAQIDPSDERFSYRKTADGYQVIQQGREPYNVPRGSRAARSIEQVLAGNAPLPPLQPAPAPPAAPAPAPVDSAEALAAYEPPGMQAPAGEVEAAAQQVFVFDPKTGKLVQR